MQPENRHADRVMDMELHLMHLQKDFETLNEVVIGQGKRLDELAALLKQLTNKLESDDDSVGDRDPLDEKPPHY